MDDFCAVPMLGLRARTGNFGVRVDLLRPNWDFWCADWDLVRARMAISLRWGARAARAGTSGACLATSVAPDWQLLA